VCAKKYNLSGEDIWRSGIVNTQYGKVLVDGTENPSGQQQKTPGIALSVRFLYVIE